MQPQPNDELRAIFRARVPDSFEHARYCLTLARAAHQAGDLAELRKWMWCVKAFRVAAAGWRKRAEKLTPVLLCFALLLHGCAKAPAHDAPDRAFTSTFVVKAAPDGSGVIWSLQFKTREQYHAFIETTADGADRTAVRELIAAGMRLHHIVGCSPQEKTVTKLGEYGIAFVGSCEMNPAHATPAGGI